MICATCRVEVAESIARGWIHIYPIPEGVPLDHEVVPAGSEEVEELTVEYAALDTAKHRVAALRKQMAEMPGVAFTDVALDAITLLAAVENLERELVVAYGEAT